MSGIIIKLGDNGSATIAAIFLLMLASSTVDGTPLDKKDHVTKITYVQLPHDMDMVDPLDGAKARAIAKRQVDFAGMPPAGFEVVPAPPAVNGHGDLTMMVAQGPAADGAAPRGVGNQPVPRKYAADIKNCAVYMDINGGDTFDHCGYQDADLCNVCRMNTAGCCAPVAPLPSNPKAALASNNQPHRSIGECLELRGLCHAAGCCVATYSVDCLQLTMPEAEAEVYI